jgi:hypothetical protein
LADTRLDLSDHEGTITVARQALEQIQLLGPERMRSCEDWIGSAHCIYAGALLGNGNEADALVEASKAIEILRPVYDQRPAVAAEELAKATLVKARCLRALGQPGDSAIVINDGLTLLSTLIERHRAKLRRVLGDLLAELSEVDPDSVAASPAAEIASLLETEKSIGPQISANERE